MEQGISIVFPHILNDENDRVLQLNLKMIKENTTCPYEILYLANTGRMDLVYKGWNFLIENSRYPLCLWHNTDLVLAPGWNENVIKHQDKSPWMCFRLIETGAIGVSESMINKDFGRTAETFRRSEFETFVAQESKKYKEWEYGFIWYCDSVLNRDWFLSMGGFPEDKPFPHPNDIEFRNHVEAGGCKQIIVNSWAYHFQRGHIHQGLQKERV